MLRELERKILSDLQVLCMQERRGPAALGSEPEPTWACAFAQEDNVLAQAVCAPGDAEDAVTVLWQKISERADAMDLTLYMTLEPGAIYDRRRPVTESVRDTGVQRVIVGTENPDSRARGQGVETLQQMGVRVELADGEEARSCQLLYEDFAKAMNQRIPYLRIFWELKQTEQAGRIVAEPFTGKPPLPVDGVLLDMDIYLRGSEPNTNADWIVILDTFGSLGALNEALGEIAKRTIVLTGDRGGELAKRTENLKASGATVITVPMRGDRLNVALGFRELRNLGIMSLGCFSGSELWQKVVSDGLVDAVCSLWQDVSEENGSKWAQLGRTTIIAGENKPREFRLENTQLLERRGKSLWLQSGVQCLPTTTVAAQRQNEAMGTEEAAPKPIS